MASPVMGSKAPIATAGGARRSGLGRWLLPGAVGVVLVVGLPTLLILGIVVYYLAFAEEQVVDKVNNKLADLKARVRGSRAFRRFHTIREMGEDLLAPPSSDGRDGGAPSPNDDNEAPPPLREPLPTRKLPTTIEVEKGVPPVQYIPPPPYIPLPPPSPVNNQEAKPVPQHVRPLHGLPTYGDEEEVSYSEIIIPRPLHSRKQTDKEESVSFVPPVIDPAVVVPPRPTVVIGNEGIVDEGRADPFVRDHEGRPLKLRAGAKSQAEVSEDIITSVHASANPNSLVDSSVNPREEISEEVKQYVDQQPAAVKERLVHWLSSASEVTKKRVVTVAKRMRNRLRRRGLLEEEEGSEIILEQPGKVLADNQDTSVDNAAANDDETRKTVTATLAATEVAKMKADDAYTAWQDFRETPICGRSPEMVNTIGGQPSTETIQTKPTGRMNSTTFCCDVGVHGCRAFSTLWEKESNHQRFLFIQVPDQTLFFPPSPTVTKMKDSQPPLTKINPPEEMTARTPAAVQVEIAIQTDQNPNPAPDPNPNPAPDPTPKGSASEEATIEQDQELSPRKLSWWRPRCWPELLLDKWLSLSVKWKFGSIILIWIAIDVRRVEGMSLGKLLHCAGSSWMVPSTFIARRRVLSLLNILHQSL